MWVQSVGLVVQVCLPFIVPTCGRWSGNSRYFANVSKNERNSLLLPALLLCAWWIACKYGSISHFKAVFSVVWGACVGLFVLRALRGLCGFCARVGLGGLKACGVFASVFLSFSLCLPFVSPCLSSGFPCGSLCFLFPLRTIRKKKGRKGFAPCVLSSCVVCV